jgi:DNA-binding response OmpR family regulator
MNCAEPLYGGLSSAYARVMRTLIVDQDQRLVAKLATTLRRDGYDVSTSRSGQDAIEMVVERPPDAMLLECHLPDIDGMEICRRVRQLPGYVRILMFSRGADVDERVRGLEAGADAYMSKPLIVTELRARLNALLRKHEPVAGASSLTARTWGGVTLERDGYTVSAPGGWRELTPTECRLLEVFMSQPERILSNAEIGEAVWRTVSPDAATLRVYVGYLRGKLRDCAAAPLIECVPGEGYALRRP